MTPRMAARPPKNDKARMGVRTIAPLWVELAKLVGPRVEVMVDREEDEVGDLEMVAAAGKEAEEALDEEEVIVVLPVAMAA